MTGVSDLQGTARTFVILAGGSSRRFGSDKALSIVPGTDATMLETMVGIGLDVCAHVLIVGQRRMNTPDHRVLWVADRFPGEGPLGGLVTAGGTGLVGRAIVMGTDQPYISPALLRQLESRSSDLDAPVSFADSGIIHPLPVALDLQEASARLKSAFLAGERSLRAALLEVGLQAIEAGPVELRLLRDIDRPSDFLDPADD